MEVKYFMESKFDGSVAGNFGTTFVQILLYIALGWLFGMGIAMGTVYKHRWVKSHTIVDGQRLSFNGTWVSYWGKTIVWCLLSVVTIGIYGAFFMPVANLKWFAENTSIA